ncbi:MAG: hypothetical protein ACQESV_02690 [Thermodesulfobacteriota bacterium]
MERHLSFFDCQPQQQHLGSSRDLWQWQMWYRLPYLEFVQHFYELHNEAPILWRRLKTFPATLYLTEPENAFFVHRETGELVDPPALRHKAWRLELSRFSADRRCHISPQIVRLLNGTLSPEQWSPEVAENLRFEPAMQEMLLETLHNWGLTYCFTKEGYKGYITVFGEPQKLFKFFTVGVEKGVLKVL